MTLKEALKTGMNFRSKSMGGNEWYKAGHHQYTLSTKELLEDEWTADIKPSWIEFIFDEERGWDIPAGMKGRKWRVRADEIVPFGALPKGGDE